MDDAQTHAPTRLAAWREQTSPLYQAAFAVGLFFFAASLLAGLAGSVRIFGLPPIGNDVTVLAKHLMLEGDLAGAVEEFRSAAMLMPTEYDPPPEMIFAAPKENAPPAELRRKRQQVRAQPEDAAAHLALGIELLERGLGGQGLVSIERAVALDPQLPGLGGWLGRAYAEAGRSADAEQVFRREIERAPEDAALYEGLGLALYRQGSLAESARAFARAQELRATQGEGAP